ncbi:CDC48 family AAA ATPase [Methanospirillum sp. J.3.6.1-F.2.7.3]|jgi:transitional endoplasmic reticulum ATPase|uniref:CDC48 family AAA ATPase n=1 Tax=Methanospirillum purgamenti TaxID=2834276 RepID=A0A8E7EJA9_9EURY|nr:MULTISPECIES: CDC48 family AAA ATPase [Methanospirillum]MDX8549565.1 CDC48 family AAA ATPase [Methanospirillum hungatei]NLW76104.1 CDC48 family AAA ATPase [Methanomicrobiales archaeon]QVV88949.1 CDC48 family AAA ATPase [Methanospirillum sp. J.3.6.1-F.2.7.3]
MELYLRVDSAYPGDQGGGKARLDPETMNQMRLSPGDIIRISGRSTTVAKVWRAQLADWNQQKIRIDNFTRMNANVSIGDTVKITKVDETISAATVVLAPPEDLPKNIPMAEPPAILHNLIDFPVAIGDSVPISIGMPFVQPQMVAYKVIELDPPEAVIITQRTEVIVSDSPISGFEGISQITYEDIGGLRDELQRLRETIELPMRHPELFRRLGIEPPKGVLLFGPPGTGKTLIAKAVANESGAHFIPIAGPEVISKYYGESEQRLREVFEEAADNAPSIIFIDELDSITPKREEVTGEVERRVVAQLLTMMDGLEERGQVVVIGATNRLDAIDPALRRPGRFDREIEIGVPSNPDRIEILKIHTRGMPLYDDVSLEELAERTHGYTGADIAALSREAAIRALRRYLPHINLDEDEIPEEVLETMVVTGKDFHQALREITPSGMREVMLEVSHLRWRDVGGLSEAIEEIREAVEYPLTRREKYDDLGIQSPRGVLLYGPPGTGKTLLAKAVANESGANFIAVRGPQLLSKWVGESERAVREIFKKARQVSPAIIFFDELDALTPARGTAGDSHTMESVLNQFLTEMDGLVDLRDVVVMGATNRPDIVDPALLRSGRFDRLIYIGEPGVSDRIDILKIHSRLIPIEGTTLESLVDLTQNFTEEDFEILAGTFPQEVRCSGPELEEKIRSVAPSQGTISRSVRRRMLVEILEKNRIIIEDPTLETLFSGIASRTEGYVGADLEGLCREAAIFAMRDQLHSVRKEHFERALEKVHPTMNQRLREAYDRVKTHFKGGMPKKAEPPEYQ